MCQTREQGLVIAIAVMMAAGPLLGSALAQQESQPNEWMQDDHWIPQGEQHYGEAVAIDANTAVVGALGANQGSPGFVEIRHSVSGNWETVTTFQAKNTSGGDSFGAAVDIDEDLIIVGDPQSYTATILEKGTEGWERAATLQGSSDSNFGGGVAIDAETRTALVGAPRDDTAGEDAGAAYIVTESGGWKTTRISLQASDADNGDGFGSDVDLEATTALVGSIGDDEVANNAGAAYVFEKTGESWAVTSKTKLTVDHGGDHDFDSVGHAVDLEGNRALVGAPGHFHPPNLGAGFLFATNGTQIAELLDDKVVGIGGIGRGVALEDGVAVLGDFNDGAYAFTEENGWAQTDALLARDDADPLSQYGVSVAIDNSTVLVGATRAGDLRAQHHDAGGVWVFVPSDLAVPGPVA